MANTTLDAKDFTNCRGGLLIRANNITITRSKIYDSVHGMEQNGYAFTVSDSLIDGAMSNGFACINCGVDGWNWTVLRTEIVHTNRGAYCMNHCVLRDSWIHAVNLQPIVSNEAHASAARVEQFATLTHNTLSCDFAGPFVNDEIGCSADMSGYADFAPINHNTMTNNLFVANVHSFYFCAYGGGTTGKPHSGDAANATYIVFVDNVFGRGTGYCGLNDPPPAGHGYAITDFISGRTGNVWTNNRWSDGPLVSPA